LNFAIDYNGTTKALTLTLSDTKKTQLQQSMKSAQDLMKKKGQLARARLQAQDLKNEIAAQADKQKKLQDVMHEIHSLEEEVANLSGR
jgi:hypothetical protein